MTARSQQNGELPIRKHAPHTIGVVIPAYNAEPYLNEAIRSALAQTRPADEIIVVNDGSTDNTEHIASSFGDKVRLISQHKQGPAAARNTGIRAAYSDWIAFLDADDVWFPHKLAVQCNALGKIGSSALLCSTTRPYELEEPSLVISSAVDADMTRLILRRLLVRNRIVTSTVLVKKTELETIGGFDTRYCGPEDFACWLKLAEHLPIWRIEQPLIKYRIVQNSLSQQAIKMRNQEIQIVGEACSRARELLPLHVKYQALAGVYVRAAIKLAEDSQNSKALDNILNSVLYWPLSIPEYSKQTNMIRLRLIRRVCLAQLRRNSKSSASGTSAVP